MKFRISKQIFDNYPGLHVGVIIAKGIDNTGSDEKLHHLLEEVEKMIQLDWTPEKLSENPMISAWRCAYSKFGAKPSKYNCSVEALMRRVIKGHITPRINKLVDMYNYFSLKYLIPMGGDDLDKVEGDINLTFAKGDENYVEIGGKEKKHPEKDEVIYKDEKDVLCRRWNYREADKTKITKDTKNVIIYAEGLAPFKKAELKKILEEVEDLLKAALGGTVKHFILDKTNLELKL